MLGRDGARVARGRVGAVERLVAGELGGGRGRGGRRAGAVDGDHFGFFGGGGVDGAVG